MEAGWGGTPQQRMNAKYASYAARYGTSAPKVEASPEAVVRKQEAQSSSGAPAQPLERGPVAPPPEPVAERAPAAGAPSPAPAPASPAAVTP